MTLRYGRKPQHPRWVRQRVVLDLHTDWAQLTASVPAAVDRTTGVKSWPMYMNDRLGDCGEAGAGHAVQAVAAMAGTTLTPADSDIEYLYEKTGGYVPGDPSTDGGTNLQDLLTWWSANDWGGLRVSAFAQVRSQDPAALRACLYYFGTVYAGVSFPAGGMRQFQAGQPWTPVPGDSIDGGHCIVLEAATADELTWITWGAKQKSDLAWWAAYAEEAWVIMTPQSLASPPPGINVAGVQAMFRSLTV